MIVQSVRHQVIKARKLQALRKTKPEVEKSNVVWAKSWLSIATLIVGGVWMYDLFCMDYKSSQEIFELNVQEGRLDLPMILFYTGFFRFLQFCIFKPLALQLTARSYATSKSQRKKLVESIWKLGCYSIMTTFGAIVAYQEGLGFEPAWLWDDYPRHSIGKFGRQFYFLQFSLYIHMCSTITRETVRKDYFEMIFHHCVAACLVAMSYLLRFTRVGLLVMVIHDPSDALLELAKILNYMNKPTFCNVAFSAFAGSWIYMRIYLFCYKLTWHIPVEAPKYLKLAYGFPPFRNFFLTLLWSLSILHFYWTVLILKMAIRIMVQPEKAKDVRSDSEEDKD